MNALSERLRVFSDVLGRIEPWMLDEVRFDPHAGVIVLQILLPRREQWVCPECFSLVTIHDYASRTWRHVDMFGLRFTVRSRVPRLNCPSHGTRRLPVPWAVPGSRFTSAFEALACAIAESTCVRAMATRLDLSWDEAHGIVRRAARSEARLLPMAALPRPAS